MSESYYSQRARSVCVSLSVFSFITQHVQLTMFLFLQLLLVGPLFSLTMC